MDFVRIAAPAQAPEELELDLLENGIDFVREGIEAVYGAGGTPLPRAYKYALLHMFAGALLILKERLRREDEALIFLKEDMTVGFREVIPLLEERAGVELDEPDVALLRKVRRLRNSLEHHKVTLVLKEADAIVGGLVEFLERFVHEELEESLLRHLAPEAREKVERLAKVAERVRARRLAVADMQGAAYLELSDAELARMAAEAAWDPKDNPGGGLESCPECFQPSLARPEAKVGVHPVWWTVAWWVTPRLSDLPSARNRLG